MPPTRANVPRGDRDHPPGEDKIGVVDLIGPAFLVRLCRFGGKARRLSLLRGEAFGFCGGLFRVNAGLRLGTGGLIGREGGRAAPQWQQPMRRPPPAWFWAWRWRRVCSRL